MALFHVSHPPWLRPVGVRTSYIHFSNVSWTPRVLDPITNSFLGPSSWLHPASELHAFPAIRRTGCFSGDHTSQQVSQPPKGRVPSEEPGSWGQVGSRAWFHTRCSGFRWVGPTSRAWFSSEESCLCFAWLANSVPPPYGWDPLTNVRTGEFTVGRPGARSRHVTHQFGEWPCTPAPGVPAPGRQRTNSPVVQETCGESRDGMGTL